MDNRILSRATKYLSKQRKRARWHKIISILAAIVVFGTTYALILPAITMEKTIVCEKEEHIHTDNCYKEQKVLVCQQEEGAEHTHTDQCYQTEKILACGKEEHTHDDNCYQAVKGDPDADVEKQSDWEKTLEQVPLSGDWSEDVLAVADSQLGYTESTKNYVEAEDGTLKGYTRYGEWYGKPYEDWSAMFVSFCLHYAEVENIPLAADCNEWITELQKEAYGLYHEADQYTPVAGDLVFFHMDPSGNLSDQKNADHVGLVKEIIPASGTVPAKIKVIEGDSDDTVQYVVYDVTDDLILGYGQLPEEPKEDAADTSNGEESANSDKEAQTENETVDDSSDIADTDDDTKQEQSEEDEISEEDQAMIDDVIAKIDALPSSQEIEDTLTTYEEDGLDDEYEAYYEEVHLQIMRVYVEYESLSEALREKVANRDKLLELEWIWGVMPFSTTTTVDVTAVNSFNWDGFGGALIVHNDNGTTVKNAGMNETVFAYWYAVRVEKENGVFVVKEIYSAGKESSKADVYASGSGFVLLYHPSTLGTSINVNIGDTATVSSDFWKTTHSYTGTVYGTVKFSSPAAQKNAKDNTSQLHVVDSATTKDFIELNLYDYGSGSTGKNINDNFNANKNMPGFQQSGGTKSIDSLDDFKSTGYMNFGDIVTSDLADGRLVTIASENPQGINVVRDTANSPISRYSVVMSKSLINGYPALSDGTSLGYLFGAEGSGDYSKKMNNNSVDGLFQYNETTGAYSFNSRENFAQFNSGSDTFTLYDEIFTPNFIMYPFGNFMPFNDIVHDSKQVSRINKDYFEELRLQANYLYQQGKGDQYAQLAKVLGQFMDYAKQDNWGEDWTAERALEHYFFYGSELPSIDDKDNNYKQISLDRLYSLDYDVASDFYFGMEMKMNFMQPKGGLTGKDGQQEMKFYFTGDDDVWVYLDGTLFLDLSGIHRHVGGEIDFVNGEVKYYSLDTKTGDVSTTPYKTVKFSELVDASVLNEKGTFKDYSSHSFNFYYMERGSGSSVCRMNFNFPLLRKNSISVTKELSVDEQDKLDMLGNPDFKFQVLKEGGNELFINAGTSYDIYDGNQNKIGTGTTDANGVFTLKANQTAVFSGINENSGKYFVRELLNPDAFKQYGTITVDGISQTENYNVTVGSDTFKGVDSPVKDMSNGSTAFTFNNQITFSKLGSLQIEKKVEGSQPADQVFNFNVTLDRDPLPAGAVYTVTKVDGTTENRTVETAGIISLNAGEKATISDIIAGSQFIVQETEASANGYTVTYSGDNVNTSGGIATGVIKTDTSILVIVTNIERATSVTIPVIKNLKNPDSESHTYTFTLKQVTDLSGNTEMQDGVSLSADIVFGGDTELKNTSFTLSYLERNITSLPAVYYYKICETVNENDTSTEYDNTVYVAEVTVTTEGEGELTSSVTGLWKDGEKIQTSDSVVFNNKQLRTLTISKKVEGMVGENQEFSFTVVLSQNAIPLSGTYSCTRRTADGTESTESITLDDAGKAAFKLKDGESLKISGLPYGVKWVVEEAGSKDFVVKYVIGSGAETEGNSAAGDVIVGSDTVQFVNYSTYELPESGGSGTKWYTIGGLVLLFGAFLMYRKIRKRKGATSTY